MSKSDIDMLLFQIKLRIIIETEINRELIMKFVLSIVLFFAISCSFPTNTDEITEEVEEPLFACIIYTDPSLYPQPLISQDSLISLVLSDLSHIDYEGLIIVHFSVNEFGKVQNPIMLNKDSSLINISLRKIKEAPFNPALQNGQPVVGDFAFPLNMRLVN